MGKLQSGQTIVGGLNTNGIIKSHNHRWYEAWSYEGSDGKNHQNFLDGFVTYNAQGESFEVGYSTTMENYNTEGYTNFTGGSYNIPYGLGLGNTMYIWRRNQ